MSKSYATLDAVVGDMKPSRGRHGCHPTSRPEEQPRELPACENQYEDVLFAKLLFINDEEKSDRNKTLRRQLKKCIQPGHTAESIRDERLVGLPGNHLPANQAGIPELPQAPSDQPGHHEHHL